MEDERCWIGSSFLPVLMLCDHQKKKKKKDDEKKEAKKRRKGKELT